MEEEKKSKTTAEEADEYIEKMKEKISGYSAHEKNSILLDKVHFWYESAIDWRSNYEEERDRSLKNIERGKRIR